MTENETPCREYVPSPSERVRTQVALYEATGGAEGASNDGRPVVILTSIGAKTGAIRQNPVMRVAYDGVYAAVASGGGSARNPSWYRNLVAHPDVQLQDGPALLRLRARELAGPEKDEWLKIADALYPTYATYRASVEREVPILVLEPAGEPA